MGLAELYPPVQFHNLKLMALSAAHYRASAEKDTQAIERGRALHSIVLGGQRVLTYPGKVRRGKEYDAFCAANPNALIITRSDWECVQGMANQVFAHKRAMEVLQGQHELEVDWKFLGRSCQSHIDVLGPGGRYVTELKSAVSSEPGRFSWQAHKMAYTAQLAFYWEAVLQAELGTPEEAYVVAVESKEPYVVTVMRLTERALEMGRKSFRLWFERLLGCEAANDWPGYVQDIVDLDAPEEDVELTFGPGGGDDLPPHDPDTGEVAA